MSGDYLMDSGLVKSYPATGVEKDQTGTINYKFRLGTKCKRCGEEFRDGDVARRASGGFKHEVCPLRSASRG